MDAAEIYRQRAENAERAIRTDRYPSRWLIASAIVQN
jgi:hypothetical protein